ncbi:MAG: tRNA (adenosine(37)-N6)-threonylcarbamoyltransferase complex dimerization subunit type 1 TsaB [Nocardioidaceae bacterium]|nr:tRNA (adenosine(37)-N6)-threonylcarbamoyltransferase complex dimerization subunit type 1 TsaB [Nocardioidaceae bacterium]
MLLAFDTATHAVTVALHDGNRVVAESTAVDPLRHGELLAPSIRGVLADARVTMRDVASIAVGVGPGPFTGLRVGLVTARTLATVLEVRAVGVCTLDVVAAGVTSQGSFMVATDARRKEVYWARYSSPTHRVSGPAVSKPAQVADDGPVAGMGPRLYPADFPHALTPELPTAADLARLVSTGDARLLPVEPLYLRRPDISEPGLRKRVAR